MYQRTPLKRKRLSPNDRIAEILAHARDLLVEKGHENFLPTDVAARCDVSEATIYRYFPTKRDLLISVAEQWFKEILEVLPAVEQHEDVFEKLRYFIHRSLSIVKNDPALSRMVLVELRSDPSYRAMPIYKMNRRFTSTVTKLVIEGRNKGIFRNDCPPAVIRDMVFGCIEHRTWAYLRGQGDVSVEEDANSIAQIIFRGLSFEQTHDIKPTRAVLDRLEGEAKILTDIIQNLKLTLGVNDAAPAARRPGRKK